MKDHGVDNIIIIDRRNDNRRMKPFVLDRIKTEVMNMKNFDNKTLIGSKGKIAGVAICLVAMIAFMGTYTINKFQSNLEQQLAEAELEFNINDIGQAELTNTNEIQNEATDIVIQDETPASTEVAASPQFTFTTDSTLKWPVDGGVIMRYSMDQSIYFATLDQYKRSDAMVISGEVGAQVLASEYGIVTIIDDSVETGTTITVDMGNGYEAKYGQLTDLKISSGSIVEKGQIIGYVGEPTRYYTVEGANVYFQLLYEGTAVDPLEYLE